MAMGRRKKRNQWKLWIEERALAKAPGHPFYEELSVVLEESAPGPQAERAVDLGTGAILGITLQPAD